MVKGQNNIWIVHSDGSRNWVGKPTSGCAGNALLVPDVEVYQKRSSNYELNEQDSAAACQNNNCELAVWRLCRQTHLCVYSED